MVLHAIAVLALSRGLYILHLVMMMMMMMMISMMNDIDQMRNQSERRSPPPSRTLFHFLTRPRRPGFALLQLMMWDPLVTNENYDRNVTLQTFSIYSMMIMCLKMKVMMVSRVKSFEDFFRKSLSYSQCPTPILATQQCIGQQR